MKTSTTSRPGLRPSAAQPRRPDAGAAAAGVLLPAALALGTAPWPAPAEARDTEPIVVLGSGAEQRAFDTPYAASVVDAATLRASGPLVNLSEALPRVPGLTANLRNNYAQDLQISSRGFGARASFGVRGMRLFSDGIPAAGPDGQGQVSHFDLASADRVEVLRGPFSALYGSSSGGVIALVSRAPTAGALELAADSGRDGLHQLRASLATPLPDGWSLRAAASRFETDGPRPHGGAQRSSAHLRLERSGDGDRLLLLLNTLDLPAEDPLGLTRAQFDANPRQTSALAVQFDTRKTTRQNQAGLQWSHGFADAPAGLQRGQVSLYVGERSVTQWQAIAAAAQAPARHPGGVIDFDRRYRGLDARLVWRWQGVRVTAGVALDDQQEDRRGYENFIGTGSSQLLGVTGRLRRDEDNRARSADAYAQAEWDLAPTLTASSGLRTSRLRLTSRDRYLGNGDDSGRMQFSSTLPVAALRWQPAEGLSLYVSAGRGFETPTLNELAYQADGSAGFNLALRAQRSRQAEVGMKWRDAAETLAAELALFEARTRDEIGVQGNSGGRATFQNVGRTTRRGAELQARAWLNARWRLAMAATWLDARYADSFTTCAGTPCTTPTVPVTAGLRIAGTLPRTGFMELVHRRGALELGLEARAQGAQPVNDANSDFAAGHGLLSARALWAQDVGAGTLEWLARVDNLADRRVAGSVIVNEGNQRFFEPAAGRTWLVSLRWRQRI